MGDRSGLWFRLVLTVLFVAMAVELALLIRQNRELKAVIAASGTVRSSPVPEQPLLGIRPGHVVGTLKARTLDGVETDVGYESPGRRTAVLIFSPDCPSCRANVAVWNSFRQVHASASLDFLAISSAGPDVTMEFVRQSALEGTVLLADIDVLRGYDITHIPTTIVVAPGGVVERVWVGVLPDDALDPEALSG